MSRRKKNQKVSMYKGLPLIDATSDLEIEIKKGDISTARKKDPANCAAANAAKRILKTEVEVHISRIYVKKNKKWVRYKTPERISREITSFDRGSIFEPGDYTFKAPNPSCRLGVRQSSSDSKSLSTARKIPRRATMNIREHAK